MTAPLERFSAPVRRWFDSAFEAPTPPQVLGWPEIARGRHTLISAPTGSGKTLAAFLWCLDELARAAELPPGIHTLYVSPLKALGYDVERNLRQPLRGIRAACRELGLAPPEIRVAVRTGDTSASQRAAMLRKPPHLLITTPESLFILLTSPRARPLLSRVRYLVLDEVHALCGNKRGASLTLSLERVVQLVLAGGQPEPVRVGLSATVRPLEEAARFLGGQRPAGRRLVPRPVQLVDAGRRKDLDLEVVAPVPDYTQLAGDSVWPEVHSLLLDWIRQHRSTLVFVRMRAQAERLSRALSQQAGADLARAHHGSLARAVRRELEEQLKQGKLPALVSTGTLELGIDVGAIDLVVQAGSPGAVSSGLQRVGRAGHLLTERSRGRLLALHREDLVECAVIAERMLRGEIEPLRVPHSPLDVLAQHLLSAAAMDGPCAVDELLAVFRRAAPYRSLGRPALDAVLGLLAGRYPAEVARGLTAKLVWERSTDQLAALPGAARLAVTTGGTIPDRGYYTLQLKDGSRLGELEEEFVFERTVGDVIAFGAGTWRITDIDRQRVTVAPASGAKAVIPFWKGGLFGRDPELGRAIGAFRRELYRRVEQPAAAERWLREGYPVDAWAAANLVQYFADQRRREAELGTDRQVVLEHFLDDLGDHNLLLHSTFGNRLNAPWAMALRARLRQRVGLDAQVISDDNGILIRLPAGDAPPPMDLAGWIGADEVEELVTEELPSTAMYGTLFRETAARFLVLGTHGVARRTPLWLQRLRAKDLQQTTADLPDFPVRLEAFRECLEQLMDLPRLRELLEGIGGGELRLVQQRRDRPSPVASGLLQRFIGQYMYEYDEPRAERSLRRLQLDRDLLDQVLGRQDAHELLLPEATDELERRWQGRDDRSRARTADELLATLFRLVLLLEVELPEHCAGEDPAPLLAGLLADGRLSRFVVGGTAWLCASEDLPLVARAHHPRRIRVDPPRELGRVGAQPRRVREQLLARIVDSRGPSSVLELQLRSGLDADQTLAAVEALIRQGKLRRGHFRADLPEPVVCTPLNLEQIRRRSLGHLRRRVQPVPAARLQHLVLQLQREADIEQVVAGLALRPLPAEVLERDLLPLRLGPAGAREKPLDELVASGALLWTGHGRGRIVICPRDLLPLRGRLRASQEPQQELDEQARALLALLERRGASFVGDLAAELPGLPVAELQRRLWDLVWAGRLTNDRLASLRQGLADSFAPASAKEPPRTLSSLTGRPSSYVRPRRGPRRPAGGIQGGPWAGRWAVLPEAPETPAEVESLVWLLVQRHGLLARELCEQESVVRWGELYPALCQLELAGELARGLFVEGLGPAQFAPSEIVDRLRGPGEAEDNAPLLVNSCDPALVAPALGLPLPGGALTRRPSTYLVLDAGQPLLVLETAGSRLHLDLAAPAQRRRPALEALADLLRRGPRAVRIGEINGTPALRSPLRGLLEELGYRPDGRVLEIRRY